MFEGPEKKFQKHIFEYLVREHRYGILEQAEITDTGSSNIIFNHKGYFSFLENGEL